MNVKCQAVQAPPGRIPAFAARPRERRTPAVETTGGASCLGRLPSVVKAAVPAKCGAQPATTQHKKGS